MSDHATRRGFLRKTAATGGYLVMQGLSRTGQTAQPPQSRQPAVAAKNAGLVGDSLGPGLNAPIVVVTQSVSRDVNARAGAWAYITEILRRAGLFFDQLSPDHLPSLVRNSNRVVLLAGNLRLTSAQREVVTTWVRGGGALVGIGGTSGLDDVFGATAETPLAEGWIKVTAREHPVTAGLRSALHVFGGCVVKPSAATSLAGLEAGGRMAKGSAILENRFGEGRAILIGPDLLFSIVHIQQGVPVFQDGKPAPDESAALDDGILKAEDGLVLDWRRDRTPMQPGGIPVFLEPISDELREIILRSIFHLASQRGITLPMLWVWPRGLKAVGHVSHDTDGHDPKKAAAMLEVVNRCKVKTTWCTLYPGGYPQEFFRTLKEQAFEIALHYDALNGGEWRSWSKDNFVFQHRWLMKEAALQHITSNKNHYTRWEGRLQFLRWCEELGINSDQTRGPSKKGTIGFPLGGSQPYFALDDEADAPRFLNVLEVNMLTQDLVVVCPREYGKQLVDCVLRHHGVAHFLFHPAHILEPNVADTLCGLVDYGRAQGMEWWTNEQIYHWEVLRRSVEAGFDSHNAFVLRSGKPLHQATLLLLRSRHEPQPMSVNGQPLGSTPWNLHGFQFDAVTLDIAGEVKVRVA